uniref:Uncharacterized protein n=1 Tax=Oryza glumipatula TaxID=40148 RepID=A0A0D9YMI7_9ORYZ
MLLDDTSSSGKPPDNELHDKFILSKPMSSPRDGEMLPSRPERNWRRDSLSCSDRQVSSSWNRPLQVIVGDVEFREEVQVVQKKVGIGPVKLLLLALSTTRFSISFHELDRNRNPPDSELCDRFRRCKPGSLPRAGDMLPSSFLEASKTSVIVTALLAVLLLLLLQVMPSHEQQSVPCLHDAARPPWPSCESPAKNWRRQFLSWSVQQLIEDAENRISARTRQRLGMLLLLALRATRLFITFHVVDGNCPANKLLEMFSTCRGRIVV